MPALGRRLDVVKPSATVAIATKAREMKASGVDVLSFSVGEPDFDTPAHIRARAAVAIEEGATRYTAAKGMPALVDAIRSASQRRRGVSHEASEVIVSVGAKHTLFNLAMALFDPGDEVLIPAPYWVSYPEQVRIAGAEPITLVTEESDGFRLDPKVLKAALTSKTKALILCSPSNPTGGAYRREDLRALADVLAASDCWIIVDEIYAELVYEGFDQASILEVAPELRDRIIIVDGVSKTYAMTGWRIGWALGPAHVVGACAKLQSQSTTNPTTVAQHAAVAALNGPQDCIEEMKTAFLARRDRVVAGLNAIEGITCRVPDGAFYVFPNVSGVLGKSSDSGVIDTDLALCSYLLDAARCALVPGTAFGAPGFARFSYATSMEQIDEGVRRIGEAIAALR